MILVLDFGGQYTQLIARKVRELSVKSVILPFNAPIAEMKALAPEGVILSGGPASIFAPGAPQLNPKIFDLGIPVLGICYGLQAAARLFGGKVARGKAGEYGRAQLSIRKTDPFFAGVKTKSLNVWMSHFDRVDALPKGFTVTASTDHCPFAAASDPARKFWGVQFHPEVHHTEDGKRLLSNFVLHICGSKANWKMSRFIEEQIEQLREQCAGRRVVCAVSGGVDSTVLAVLLHKAIGSRMKPVFVDNGVLRADEPKRVVSRFRDQLGIKVKHLKTADLFLGKLKGVSDPERKRKIIGQTFIDVFFPQLGTRDLLAQGTLYPDVIESVSTKGPSATIKTHHNRVEAVLKLIKQGRVVEPLKDLFKDEVRAVGKELGIPADLLWRHPFPGPGLAVRILGEITPERLAPLRAADTILIEELRSSGLYEKIWQAFCVLLPIRTVGVMGDERTYANCIAVRAVASVDGMTADWFEIPKPVLGKISSRIINEVRGINRVVYDISSKPPATIEWE